jgi:thiosulfate reductase cytochrome b subunit
LADVELWLGLPGAVLITSADFTWHFEAAKMKYFLLRHNNSMTIKLVSWLRDVNRKTRLYLDKLQSRFYEQNSEFEQALSMDA